MKVLVYGGSRTGTNMVVEILSGSTELLPYEHRKAKLDYRGFFRVPVVHQNNFLGKSNTDFCTNHEQLNTLLHLNPDLQIIYTFRHPYDMILSKVYRGTRNTKRYATDASKKRCLWDIHDALAQYKHLINIHKHVLLVKQEDVIRNIENETRRMCEFLSIEYNPIMLDFMSRMRNKKKRISYGNSLDKTQVDMYKHLDTIYDGWFLNPDIPPEFQNIQSWFPEVNSVCRELNYETLEENGK